MATHALFEALGVDYKLVEIDLSKGEQKSPEYLAINPNGKVQRETAIKSPLLSLIRKTIKQGVTLK